MKFGGICISMCQCGSSGGRIRSDRQMEQCRKMDRAQKNGGLQIVCKKSGGRNRRQDRTGHSEAEEEDKGKVNDCL